MGYADHVPSTVDAQALTPDEETQPVLVVLSTSWSATRPLPERGDFTIGRHADNDLCLDDPQVSRHHAVLHLGPAGLEVEDLGGTNGTIVAGQDLPQGGRRSLSMGEPIQIGATVMVVRTGPAPTEPRVEPLVRSPVMQRLYEEAEQVAQGRLSVLLLGETGVGKEVLARFVHDQSPRRDRPFITLNCGALAESLLESELFGYEKGAFTGADQLKRGLLEAADGGTVVLDEVGELPLSVQVKLLRVLENRQVLRLGALRPIAVDVRFVAATNRDLELEARQGRFRDDLYFRLAGAVLTVPPLRARPEEIEGFAQHFATLAADEACMAKVGFSDEAMRRLRSNDWPGNLRELRNAVTRAVLLSRGQPIGPEHLPAPRPTVPSPSGSRWLQVPPAPDGLSPAQREERERVVDALKVFNGNQTRAAASLGVSRQTFVKKLDRYGLPRPRK